MGERKLEEIKAKATLAEQKKGAGTIKTEILYEEADGIWLKLQGKDHQENGADKEMKAGIVYDGVLKERDAKTVSEELWIIKLHLLLWKTQLNLNLIKKE